MVKIIGVRFRNVGKIYYFNPKSFQMKPGDHVIVETARGVEYGTVVLGPKEVDDRAGGTAFKRCDPHGYTEG